MTLVVENRSYELTHDFLRFLLIGGVLSYQVHESLHSKLLTPWEVGFHDTVGVKQDAVSRLQGLNRNSCLTNGSGDGGQSPGNGRGRRQLTYSRATANEYGWRMSSIGPSHGARIKVDSGQESGGKDRSVKLTVEGLVETRVHSLEGPIFSSIVSIGAHRERRHQCRLYPVAHGVEHAKIKSSFV
jgi:hypothetical protein